MVPTLSATGRVLAAAQRSTMNVPPMDNSAMDGYAVRTADLRRPDTRLKVTQKIPAGTTGKPLVAGTAARIFTGAPIPAGADAIVMQEFCTQAGEEGRRQENPERGEWIRLTGGDIRAGGRCFPRESGCGPGHRTCRVGRHRIASCPPARTPRAIFYRRRARHAGRPAAAGRIYNSNRFHAQWPRWDFRVRDARLRDRSDSLTATREVLRRAAAECDVIVTSGGVSVGDADFVKPAVEAEGELLMWKIAMKPGRPLAFGRVARQIFIGLPGNPVSSFVTFLIFVRPFLLKTQGVADVQVHAIPVRADFDWPEPDLRREFLRVKWNARGGLDLYATRIPRC